MDNTLIKALARTFRWKRMLETGEFKTIAELAECEGIASSYMAHVLRLTLLALEVVEAIPDRRQGALRLLDSWSHSQSTEASRKIPSRHLVTSLRISRAIAAIASWANSTKTADSIAGTTP